MKHGPYYTMHEAQRKARAQAVALNHGVWIYASGDWPINGALLVVTGQEEANRFANQQVACIATVEPVHGHKPPKKPRIELFEDEAGAIGSDKDHPPHIFGRCYNCKTGGVKKIYLKPQGTFTNADWYVCTKCGTATWIDRPKAWKRYRPDPTP